MHNAYMKSRIDKYVSRDIELYGVPLVDRSVIREKGKPLADAGVVVHDPAQLAVRKTKDQKCAV